MCQSGTTAHRLSGANLIHPDDRTRASEAFEALRAGKGKLYPHLGFSAEIIE